MGPSLGECLTFFFFFIFQYHFGGTGGILFDRKGEEEFQV